jgi:S-DNA-T family DNA segregation ATPase FtsK/SpoIIIE
MGAVSAASMLDVTRPLRDGYWLFSPKKKPTLVEPELEVAPPTPEVDWFVALQETLDAYEIKADVVRLNDTGKVLDVYHLDVKKGYDITQILSKGANFSRDLGLGRGQLVGIEANIGDKQSGLYLPKADRGIVKFDPTNPPAEFVEFSKTAELPIYFGEDVVGSPIMYDLAIQPHIFYGGETQSGKSVAINTALTSLMSVRSPEQVRLSIIDPKMVDMKHLNGLPNMLHDAVVEMPKALRLLENLVGVMDKRYDILSNANVANITQYNALDGKKNMSYIISVVEELTVAVDDETPIKGGRKGDTVGKHIQGELIKLAIKSRACGIHLMIGVQRFDADTFKGQLRDNITASIGMSVRKRQSSEMLIGESGCERLLKHGDAYMMLAGSQAPIRCHGALTI